MRFGKNRSSISLNIAAFVNYMLTVKASVLSGELIKWQRQKQKPFTAVLSMAELLNLPMQKPTPKLRRRKE
jgi:hypothetical protein